MENYLDHAEDLIDQLALKIVMLEPDDVKELGEVLNDLDEIIKLVDDAGINELVQVGRTIHSITENVILHNADSTEEGVKQIEEGVSIFQEALKNLRQGQPFDAKVNSFLKSAGQSILAETPEDSTPMDEAETGPGQTEEETPPELSQDKELVESFILESMEHLDSIEVNILKLEQDPANPDVINEIFRPFHTIKGVSGFLNFTEINQLAHEVETILDEARSEKISIDGTTVDLILDAVDLLKTMIGGHLKEQLETGTTRPVDLDLGEFMNRLREIVSPAMVESEKPAPAPHEDGTDIGTILVEKEVVKKEDISEALERQKAQMPANKLGEILIAEKKATPKEVAHGLREQKKIRESQATVVKYGTQGSSFVKVDTTKLDNMMDMVGELVITQAMLREATALATTQDQQLYRHMAQLGRITSEVQGISMSMRMIPIGQTFQKMNRLIRDLSKKSGKLVNLKVEGKETEIDRNMVDAIYDPLVHMIRNSADHGIEQPDVRKASGKPETGTITLKAYHKGGNIIIEISDDGKGLNREKIIEKAIERKLIKSAENISDQEIYALIFHAGFSTAETVTDVSGRGVGMDVVKGAMEEMRGSVEVHSTPGRGTTMLMKLPLTLAIIDGVIVKTGDRRYIIPTVSIIEFLKPEREACSTVVNKGEMVKIRENLVPIVRLHELFGFEPAHHDPWDCIVVVIESDGIKKGFLVDELFSKQEIVIKSLSESLKMVKGIAGGAILADGRVGLILDVAGVIKLSENHRSGISES